MPSHGGKRTCKYMGENEPANTWGKTDLQIHTLLKALEINEKSNYINSDNCFDNKVQQNSTKSRVCLRGTQIMFNVRVYINNKLTKIPCI